MQNFAPFLWVNNHLSYGGITFVHPSAHGHLAYFLVLALADGAAVSAPVQVTA